MNLLLTRMPRLVSNPQAGRGSDLERPIRRGWPWVRWPYAPYAALLLIALFTPTAWAVREIRVEPHFMFYFGYGFCQDDLHESPEDAFA